MLAWGTGVGRSRGRRHGRRRRRRAGVDSRDGEDVLEERPSDTEDSSREHDPVNELSGDPRWASSEGRLAVQFSPVRIRAEKVARRLSSLVARPVSGDKASVRSHGEKGSAEQAFVLPRDLAPCGGRQLIAKRRGIESTVTFLR